MECELRGICYLRARRIHEAMLSGNIDRLSTIAHVSIELENNTRH